MTKKINVYNKRKRAIKCITNTFDYLGDGELFYEDRLEVCKIYTMIDGKRKVFGHMVFIEEISSDCGFQSCLFEEMDEYDESILINNETQWIANKLKNHNSITKAGVKHNREIMHIIVEHNGKEESN